MPRLRPHRRFLALLVAAGLAAAVGPSRADAFPAKPVRLVLGVPAGSAPDAAARIVAEQLQALWHQPVVVENRPGAGGTIAMGVVKPAAPDGHTLLFAHAGSVVVTPRMLKVAAKFDPLADFMALGMVADSPMVLVAGTSAADATLAGMFKAAKAEPGRVALGSTEQPTLPYLVGQALAQASGTRYLHVTFNQPGQGVQALVNGDVQYYVDGIAPLLPLIKSGRVRAVAATSDRALPGLETVPLVKETLPGYVAVGWFALMGPKGLPPDVAARINRDLNQVLARSDVGAKMRDISLVPSPKSLADTQAYLKGEVERWAETIKRAGIEPL